LIGKDIFDLVTRRHTWSSRSFTLPGSNADAAVTTPIHRRLVSVFMRRTFVLLAGPGRLVQSVAFTGADFHQLSPFR
jgi:hypothetical protein